MNTYTLIKENGTREEVPYLEKNINGVIIPYVSDHIAKYEIDDNWTKEVVIFEPVIQCFEEVRKLLGRPIGINSGYRTPIYQEHLKQIGYKTATDSPHCRGAALDLAIPRGTTYLALTSLLKQAARNLGLPKPRIGTKEYGFSFVHADFVFMLFTPYTKEKNPHPEAWAKGVEW